jgi:hypothetical protein
MRRVALSVCLITVAGLAPAVSQAAAPSLADRLAGRILLQVESYGRAWYVNPREGTRYYLRNGADAYELMRTLGLGISNRDLARLPVAVGERGDAALVRRLKGRIVLAVEARGEAWYVNPLDGRRYYLKDGRAAYELLRRFGLGVKDQDLRRVPLNATQVVYDGTFSAPAYLALHRGDVAASEHADVVLPLASLTKLVTALVLTDLPFDGERTVTLTPEQIAYPRQLVGDDVTSEVELKAGDTVALQDLWVCMLVASSNQAAVALADASGLSRPVFLARMNERARALGLTRTVFADVTGLDAHNVSTAREFAVLAAAAFAAPNVAGTTRLTEHSFTVRGVDGASRLVTVKDRNRSLRGFAPDAVKTGYLVEAQNNVALQQGERVLVVLHADTLDERNAIVARLLP